MFFPDHGNPVQLNEAMQVKAVATIVFNYTEELQWREHWWLVHHDCFELVLESLGKKSHNCKFEIIKGGFLFYIENGVLCVLIRIASMRRF